MRSIDKPSKEQLFHDGSAAKMKLADQQTNANANRRGKYPPGPVKE
jgi:hypothetical protein